MVFHKNRLQETIADRNKHEIVKTGFKPAFIKVEILKMDLVIISLRNLASLCPFGN